MYNLVSDLTADPLTRVSSPGPVSPVSHSHSAAMAAVKISLLSVLLVAFVAESIAQTCNAVNKKCAATKECCTGCCLGTKCVEATQCAPKCPADLEFKCKSAAQECFLKPVTNCSKPPCKPEPACRFVPPCNRLNCPKGKHCVDIGGNPPTAACQPDPKTPAPVL